MAYAFSMSLTSLFCFRALSIVSMYLVERLIINYYEDVAQALVVFKVMLPVKHSLSSTSLVFSGGCTAVVKIAQ